MSFLSDWTRSRAEFGRDREVSRAPALFGRDRGVLLCERGVGGGSGSPSNRALRRANALLGRVIVIGPFPLEPLRPSLGLSDSL